jgi:hypothetical protein
VQPKALIHDERGNGYLDRLRSTLEVTLIIPGKEERHTGRVAFCGSKVRETAGHARP